MISIDEFDDLLSELLSAQDDVTHLNEIGELIEMRKSQRERSELRRRILAEWERALDAANGTPH